MASIAYDLGYDETFETALTSYTGMYEASSGASLGAVAIRRPYGTGIIIGCHNGTTASPAEILSPSFTVSGTASEDYTIECSVVVKAVNLRYLSAASGNWYASFCMEMRSAGAFSSPILYLIHYEDGFVTIKQRYTDTLPGTGTIEDTVYVLMGNYANETQGQSSDPYPFVLQWSIRVI